MFRILLIIALSTVVHCDDCLDFCDCESQSASCHFLPRFPIFSSTDWIKTLYITSSDLETLGIYEANFSDLERLILTNCRNVRCLEIERVQEEKPRLRIVYDENCVNEQPTTVSHIKLLINIICFYFYVNVIILKIQQTSTPTLYQPSTALHENFDTAATYATSSGTMI